MSAGRWEIGGEFHRMELPVPPFLPWPLGATWYSLGRQAVSALVEQLNGSGRRRLWIPEYFCYDVAANWAASFDLETYVDDPTREEPVWASLRVTSSDIVMAVNYFGARQFDGWDAWLTKHKCILLEDHTHDPASPWARYSRADYAFSSIRKTLAVPDGAVLWSPDGSALPKVPLSKYPERRSRGITLKTDAMLLKSQYLAGEGGPELKGRFRQLQLDGEAALETESISEASAETRNYVANGYPVNSRERRQSNAAFLTDALLDLPTAKPLHVRWPADAAPLGFVLRFQDGVERDAARERLRASNIYCPVHWPPSASWSQPLRSLSACLLTIPIDQRYGPDDMQRVVDVLAGATRGVGQCWIKRSA